MASDNHDRIPGGTRIGRRALLRAGGASLATLGGLSLRRATSQRRCAKRNPAGVAAFGDPALSSAGPATSTRLI